MSQAFVLCFLSVFSISLSSQALEPVPGEFIVRYKSSSQVGQMKALGKTTLQHNMVLQTSWSGMNLHHLKLRDGENEQAALDALKEDPDVLFAEPNYYVTAQMLSYDQTDADIMAPEAWAAGSSSAVVPVVAVLDSGLDISHSVFNGTGRLWENSAEASGSPGVDDDGNGYIDDINGWNFMDSNTNLTDNSGHGTHVSGIVVAATEDMIPGVSGQAKVQIMPLKFLDENGIGTTSDAISAIYYAVDNGAKILNNSWGGSNYSVALHEAITYSYNQGTVFVAAAGNSGTNNDQSPIFPASYDAPHVISVGSTSDSDALSSFSNYGLTSVDLSAPGEMIVSTIPGGGFGISSGTSMSSPFIAGLAALVLREAPQFSGFQVKETILNSVDQFGSLSSRFVSGGRVAFLSTVQTAQANSSDPYNLPEYTPNYDYSSASFASSAEEAGFGCGRVKDAYKRGLSSESQHRVTKNNPFAVWMMMLLLPLFFVFGIRFAVASRVTSQA